MRSVHHPWTLARRTVQLAVAVFYLALPLANGRGLRQVLGTLASLRLGPVDLTEPAAALSAALAGGAAAPLARLALGAAPAVVLALVLGPVFCSWICPFGLVSELLDRALPWRRGWPARARERGRVVRLVALAAVLAGSALLALPLAALVQGPRAITAAPQEALALGEVSRFSAAALGVLLALDLLLPRRLFCRALCPAGALAHLLRTPRTLHVALAPVRCRCASPSPCQARCAWGLDPRRAGRLDGCSSCLACLDACPHGALSATFRVMGARPTAPGTDGDPRPAAGPPAATLPASPASPPAPSPDGERGRNPR